jgi:hypothetical protein
VLGENRARGRSLLGHAGGSENTPRGLTPSGTLWSLDLGLVPWTSYDVNTETMSASFAASLLFLAILFPDNDVHYFVLDTAHLE